MGETDAKTAQGAPQTSGQSSGGQQGSTSSTQATKTYTESEVEKMVSDRLAQTGRVAKALEQREAAIKAQETAHAEWQRQRDEEQRRREEEEFEQARDNPKLLDAFQVRKAAREKEMAARAKESELTKARAEFEQEKLAHQVELESAREVQREIDCFDIAQEYEGGDPVRLKALAETFKTSSKEQIRQAADSIWAKKQATTTTTTTQTQRRFDSGVTTGGGGTGRTPSVEELKASTPQETAKKIKSGEWVLPGGWRV